MVWRVTEHRGRADTLHHLDVSEPARQVQIMRLSEPAVALGSAQSETLIDRSAVAEKGWSVVQRHSGGGLVVLVPDEIVWVDVVIPSSDPLWRHDVGEAFVWLGRVWMAAIAADHSSGCHGPQEMRVHRGNPQFRDLGRAVCFAGVGSGEVMSGDRKVVGMSQRRTRSWARFQCLVHQRFDPSVSLGVLAPHLAEGSFGDRLGARLASGVGTLGSSGSADSLIEQMVAALPD